MGMAPTRIPGPTRRITATILTLVLVLTIAWWGVGRATATARKVVVREISPEAIQPVPGTVDSPATDSGAKRESTLSALVWNMAHGRGDVREGWRNNWRGGSREVRVARLARMTEVLREADADLVVLNEVDFRAEWSLELNQAEILARGAGYPYRAEQRNYDLQLPFFSLAFGNAVLSRYPILSAELVPLPPHSELEALLLGAKTAMVVRIATDMGAVSVVPVHLEVRSPETRMAALSHLRNLAARCRDPLILAGDFNSAPSGWPRAGKGWEGRESGPGTGLGGTILDSLLANDWTSPRARGKPSPAELTFPTVAPVDARDWVLAEFPLEVLNVTVLRDPAPLSDHAPLLAQVVLKEEPAP